MKTKILFIVLAVMTVYACGSSKPTDTAMEKNPPTQVELGNGYWELVRQQGVPAIASPTDDGRKIGFSLQPDENRINGFAGCNSFFGSYTLNGASISFSQMGSTKMACVQNPIDEQAYLEMFGRAEKVRLKDDLLTLVDSANNVLAVFQRTKDNVVVKNAETTDD